MKTKLVFFFFLLFITFSVQSIANDKGCTSYISEVETLVIDESSEKDIEVEALIPITYVVCCKRCISSVLPSRIFLDNYLAKDMAYKPPILFI